MKIYNPAPGRKTTSPYGPRKHPITGEYNKMHHGIDYGGTFDVLAAQDGIIEHVGYSANGGGHVVIIKHASDFYTVYYHGRERTKFNVGDRIKAGEKVYTSGSTGASTGPHLHFEVRTPTRAWGRTADPARYMVDGKPPEDNSDIVPSIGGPENFYSGLKVDGRLGRRTWRAWQEVLKNKYGYQGIVDGKPGPMTWKAIQKSSGSKQDGIPGPNTRKAVQRRLKALKEYGGRIDGVWGKGTISALQRALNAGKY